MANPSSVEQNKKLIETFYTAFQNRDGEFMASCYSSKAQFEDAVFKLGGTRIGAMWKMLCHNGKDLKIHFSDVTANEKTGTAHWVAQYTFSGTGRKVTNRVIATFEFQDGQIIKHKDLFSFWRWAAQALGPLGILFGWTRAVRGRVQTLAAGNLEKFINKQTELRTDITNN